MRNGIYEFRLGSFLCAAISDGYFSYSPPAFPPPPQFFYSFAPRNQIELAFHRHLLQEKDRYFWVSSLNCLLIDADGHKILIDTGGGDLGEDTGKLLKNMRAVASPNYIRKIILTHGHPDHIGACVDAGGNPNFPNAKYFLSGDEWNFWRSERAVGELRDYNKNVLLKVEYYNLPAIYSQTFLTNGETEVYPGIRIIPAPGHTPGQIAVMISSGNHHLICVSDTLYQPVQIEYPEWSGISDLHPAQSVKTREKILNLAAEKPALIMGFHFPFPGIGRITRDQLGYHWHPIEVTK